MIEEIEGLIKKLTNRIQHRLDDPLPELPWIMFQRWDTLLFIHWPVPVESVKPLVPPQMEIDTYEGQAWLTLIPFRMVNVHLRDLPPVPGFSTFPEINLRLYIRVNDQPGITFFCIDADEPLAVWVASHVFNLPYLQAKMKFKRRGNVFHIESHRPASAAAPAADFKGSYWPIGEPFEPKEGTLEYFLLERYTLFNPGPGGMIYRGNIHHLPWIVQQAEAKIETNNILQASGIELPNTDPILHFSEGTDTILWPVVPLCF